MSDDNLNETTLTPEDDEILELLDRLGPESGPAACPWVATLGALPRSLAEVEPRPDLKAKLMARLAGSRPDARLVALERRARWYMPIAATLAVALLGLAVLQFRQLDAQKRTIDELSSQLASVESDGADLAEIRQLLEQKGSQLRMLTSRGAEFCLLKPVGDQPAFPLATATMVIAPDRTRWFLAAEGLEPCGGGEVCYQLWFITDADPVRGAAFDAEADGRRIELSGELEMPAGLRAISITRSPDPDAGRPGEALLHADQAMTLL